MSWVLIRHGQTQGNLEHRYIGCRTDEALCPRGIEQLQALKAPPVRLVYSSPLKRCLETAAILYPGLPVTVIPDFRECDFGDFENKNYAELNGRPDYQAWVDSGGLLPFPGGESREEFSLRCVRAFEGIRQTPCDCALIGHGGTLMAIMEKYAQPHGGYYDFQVKNGTGFILEASGRYRHLSP